MPPLCLCGLTVYAVDTSGCAQNCVFYKNPAAFQKAVEDIYQSMTA
jgi:coiled-coil domain-containing protein 15